MPQGESALAALVQQCVAVSIQGFDVRISVHIGPSTGRGTGRAGCAGFVPAKNTEKRGVLATVEVVAQQSQTPNLGIVPPLKDVSNRGEFA